MTRVHHLTSISGRQRGTTLSLFFVREDGGSKTDGPTYGQLQRSMATRCSGAAEPRPPAPRRQRGARRRLRVAAGSGPAWLPARVTPPPHTAPTNRRPRHGGRFKGAAPFAAPTCRRELPGCLPPRDRRRGARAVLRPIPLLLPARVCRGVPTERVVGAADNSADSFRKEPGEIEGK